MNIRIIIGVAGVIFGAGVGSLVTWRVLKTHYETITQNEIDSVKEHYAKLFKTGEHANLENLVKKYKTDDVDTDKSSPEFENDDKVEEIEEDIFVEDEDDESEVQNIWRYAKDNPHPEDEAYVITFEQFKDEHDDYEKGDLTYYECDDTLVDSQESPIDDVEALVGPDALDRFGDGSNSRDIVYVRNDRIGMDFEISLDSRSYTEHILGIQEPKKHKVHKMRDEE